MILRPYQTKALDDIRNCYRRGQKRVLLHLATGAGKTLVFCTVMKAVQENGSRAIIVVRGRHLVDQASQRLTREGVDHGVLMAGHWKVNPRATVQVCSVDTLRSRGLKPTADLVVIDEAHQATSSSYRDLIKLYPNAFFLAVTATPYTTKGLRHIADVVVHPITVEQLIADGYLVPPVYYAPSAPDVSGVGISTHTKDFISSELENAVFADKGLTGDIIAHWRRLAADRPTIMFAISLAHSKRLVSEFSAAGIAAEHIEANTADADRRAAISRLASGETKVVSNVGILCTGVDLPYVSAIVMARPTMSRNLHIQQAGRGTRTYPGKSDFILLDHAGNLMRHGLLTFEPEANLDPISKKQRAESDAPPVTTCTACFAVYSASTSRCPACGFVNEKRIEREKIIEGELKKLDLNNPVIRARLRLVELKQIAKTRGYKRGWIFHNLKDEFGEATASELVPLRQVPYWVGR